VSWRGGRHNSAVEHWHCVSVIVEEHEVRGHWQLRGRVLYVMSADGQAATQLGGMPATLLAETLLREISNCVGGR